VSSQNPRPADAVGASAGANKWKVLFSVIFGVFMVILDATVVNVAFATIQKEFAVSTNASQWVLSLYVMMLGIATPLAGFLGDRFGQKRIFLSAIALFAAGSLLCGLSPSLWTLIAARAVQGIGGGIAAPIGTSLLFAAFPPNERGKAMGVFGIAMVVAPALGPILGGWLVDVGHWRWIFFVNVPIGLLGVILGSMWLPKVGGDSQSKFDPLGLLFSTVGFGSVLYAASVAADKGWGSTEVLAFFGLGALALLIFALIELKVAKEPLLDLTLFKNPIFLVSALTGYVSVLALFGAEFLMPLYLQLLRGRTALEAGVLLLPMALSAAVFTPLAGQLYDRLGARSLAVTGFGLLAINTWQLSQISTTTSLHFIQFLLALRGMALGLTVQTTMITSLSVVPLQKTARASSLVNATRQVVQSLGVALLATILSTSISATTNAQLRAFQSRMPAAQSSGQRFELCAVGTPDAPPIAKMIPPQGVQLIQTFCGEYINGLEHDYKLTFGFSLLAMALGAMMPGWPGKWTRRSSRGPMPTAH